MENIKYLIDNVAIISKKYEDIAKITGENFNVFSVMSMERNEVKTHSAIIGELLNPKGSHGQGSIFLKLFFNEIKELQNINDFNFENTKIIIEEFIGRKNDDSDFSGFIDIVIKDGTNIIVIENKIDAKDQDKQLLRYKEKYKDCVLLYLNLFGSEPSINSFVKLIKDKDFHIINYQYNIKKWLEKCYKEAVEQPILRETIKQYLHLVKKLTNQTINNDMSEEIIKVIQKNFKSAKEIKDNFDNAKFEISQDIRNTIYEKLEKEFVKQRFDEIFIVQKLGEIKQKFAPIIILFKDEDLSKFRINYTVEPFNGLDNDNGKLRIMIIDYERNNFGKINASQNFKKWENYANKNSWVLEMCYINSSKTNELNFDNIDLLTKIHQSVDYKNELIEEIISQIIDYIIATKDELINICKNLDKKNS